MYLVPLRWRTCLAYTPDRDGASESIRHVLILTGVAVSSQDPATLTLRLDLKSTKVRDRPLGIPLRSRHSPHAPETRHLSSRRFTSVLVWIVRPAVHMSCVLNVLYPGTKQGNAYAASYVLLTRAQFCLRGINRLTQTLRWTFLVPGHSPSLRAATFTCRNRSVSRQHQAVEDDDVDEEDEADEDAATEEARR